MSQCVMTWIKVMPEYPFKFVPPACLCFSVHQAALKNHSAVAEMKETEVKDI